MGTQYLPDPVSRAAASGPAIFSPWPRQFWMCTSRQTLQQNPANHLKDTCTHVPTAKLLSSSLSPIPLFSRAETRNFLINPKSAARPFFQDPISSGFAFWRLPTYFPKQRGDGRSRSGTQNDVPNAPSLHNRLPNPGAKMFAPFSDGFTCPFSPQRSLVKWRGCARGLLHASLIDSLVNRKLLRSYFSFRACQLCVCLCGGDKMFLAMAEEECCNFQPI